MARYTVLARTFINNTQHEAGDVIDYDGQPGSTLQPVDAHPSVDIPDNWRDENGLKRIALARSLGAGKQRMSAAEADQWISNELANREAKAAEKKAQPVNRPPSQSLFTPLTKPVTAPPSTTPAPHDPLVPSTPIVHPTETT